jgi:release factor glutamine methyltransferase
VTELATSVRSRVRAAAVDLDRAGIESPDWDAEQLAAHVLDVPRAGLALATEFSAEQSARYDDLVARRARRVPLQHLVGTVGFRYIELDVGPGVFIPRPETEVVAGAAIALAASLASAPVVVDLCSGSGALALSIQHELPRATVHAVELDDRALEWLRRNALRRAEAGDPIVAVHAGDAQHALPEFDGTVDVVVSNPPYVAEDELVLVDPEVREHDPHVALVAGGDGLDVIRAVIGTAERLLLAGGAVVIEHSDRQGETCPALLRDRPGWVDIVDHEDLTARPRYTTARWAPGGRHG